MWISAFRISNFSSFSDSGWIELSPNFNLFIGQNNSGKSALLRALLHPLPINPHKNDTAFRGSDLPNSLIEVNLKITTDEIFENFSKVGSPVYFPLVEQTAGAVDFTIRHIQENLSHTLELNWLAGQPITPRNRGSIPVLRNTSGSFSAHFTFSDGKLTNRGIRGGDDNLGDVLNSGFSNVFHFDAQRLNIARSLLEFPQRLQGNASNLPAVLAYLQGTRRPIFDEIEKHLINILGGIQRITVAPRGNEFEILIWPHRESKFEELAFSLSDSGTGVGQLLAILTAVITSEQSIIIIDEVNSFIHPIAVKKLLRFLRSDYPHHQYIISTHSSDAISSCSAEKLYIVQRSEFRSSIKELSLSDADQAREIAGHLGFSMMDVFGIDRIVWVEGPTEEICFQYLVRNFEIVSDMDIGFAPVGSPSNITHKRRDQAIVEIYDRAGKKLSPLLKGMAFALDREKLSDEEVEKQERSKRKLKLLPRRCIECFLIEPQSIASVLSELDNRTHDPKSVLENIIEIAKDIRLGGSAQWNGDIFHHEWLKKVDGAHLLQILFDRMTENRVEYRKTRDGISILRNISENCAEHIDSLLSYLEKVMEICLRDTKP